MPTYSLICTSITWLVFWNNILNGALGVSNARTAEGKKTVDEFTEQRMMKVMQSKGVPYIPDYMAPNEDVARRQFPDMIQLNEAYRDHHHANHHFDFKNDNENTKHWLLEELNGPQNTHTAAPHSNGHSSHNTKSETDIVDKLQELTETLLRLNFSQPSILLSRLLSDTTSPFGRRKRQLTNIDGAVTASEYCKQRGTVTADGSYLRMCSTCSATTTLPEDHFPRVINEVICSNADRGCLSVNGIAHGRCTQKVFHLNMLRRTNDSLDSISQLGETEFAKQWEVYTQPIRVSCECEIDKLSVFARYIPAASPTAAP